MDTGEEGGRLFREAAAKRTHRKPEKAEERCLPSGPKAKAPAKQSAGESAQRENSVQEIGQPDTSRRSFADAGQSCVQPPRRWPPPLLMLAPVYVNGEWTDEYPDKDG